MYWYNSGYTGYTLSGHIGRVVASYMQGCKINSWVSAPIYIMQLTPCHSGGTDSAVKGSPYPCEAADNEAVNWICCL